MASSLFGTSSKDNEDTIYYWLFPHDINGHPVTSDEELNTLCSDYMAYIQPFTQEYIWFNEPFTIRVRLRSSDQSLDNLGPHLGGSMVVGDYLEDEWFVLFLLTTLCKNFPQLICRVIDSDGEFPLIEAANHLPKWADPDTADQRVYLKGGLLHLLPLTLFPLSKGSPSVMDAVSTVNSKPSETLASPAVQNAIKLRIDEYPRKISKEHHTTHAYVPVAVAALLKEYPTLVSAAVRAFCSRDARDAKCLRVMRHFPPETRVMTSVRFSKALYALMGAHPYLPDPCTGWNIPSRDNKSYVLGMKLACGFEILVTSAGGITPAATPEEPAFDSNNPQWHKYKESLAEKGYFRGEVEGSVLYRNLELNAQRFFTANNVMNQSSTDTEALSLGSIVVKLLSKVNADYETFKKKEKDLLPPDDENWLEITPDTLDEMLNGKFRRDGEEPQKKSSEQDMANSLNSFLQHSSSFQGAEIPPELLQGIRRKTSEPSFVRKSSGGSSRKSSCSGRKTSGLLSLHPQHRKISTNSNASDSSQMSSLSAKVDFNAESFTDALNNILEFSVPEDSYFESDDEGSSGMSSYEEDEDKDLSLSRKTSGGSNASKASSGVDADFRQEEPSVAPVHHKKKSSGSGLKKKKIPLVQLDDDEFDIDDDSEDPVRVDMEAVSQLLRTYSEERGVGPASSLLASLQLNPPSKS